MAVPVATLAGNGISPGTPGSLPAGFTGAPRTCSASTLGTSGDGGNFGLGVCLAFCSGMPESRRSTSFRNCCPCSQKCAGTHGVLVVKVSSGGSVDCTTAVNFQRSSSRRVFCPTTTRSRRMSRRISTVPLASSRHTSLSTTNQSG